MTPFHIRGKLRSAFQRLRVRFLYWNRDYLQAYREHTNLRVDEDPALAIGGKWERVGKLQVDFLKAEGLEPAHRLLDYGCGTLRAGRHFIRHLDRGNYVGVDISERAIEEGLALIEREGLSEKKPRLINNPEGDLRFDMLPGQTFDYIMMQSVFSHLLESHIDECFANIHKVMTPNSRWYFTFIEADSAKVHAFKDVAYPKSFFEEMAKRHGFDLTDCSADYDHPMRQRMLRAVLESR